VAKAGKARTEAPRLGNGKPIVAGLLLLAALILGIGGWLILAELSGAVVAPGTLVVFGKPKTVQHLEGGIVAAILVRDGDRVAKGEVVARLDDTQLKASHAMLLAGWAEAVARRDRLIAERDRLPAILLTEPEKHAAALLAEARAGQQRLFAARADARNGQVAQLAKRIALHRQQIAARRSQQVFLSNQTAFLHEELSGLRILKEKGLARNTQLLGLERQREQLAGGLDKLRSEIEEIGKTIEETRLRILQIDRDHQQAVLAELRETSQEISELAQQLAAIRDQLGRVEIRAPVGGIIHQLGIFTEGGVVAPGEALMQVVPVTENLIIEVKVEPQHIDQLRIGQPVVLRFSAFNQRTTPELNGTVATISADLVSVAETGLSYFLVRIALAKEEARRLAGRRLHPGMPVEAFIRTEDRTALSYLLKPLTDQIMRAFREE
jgi:HlyD family secretion protein